MKKNIKILLLLLMLLASCVEDPPTFPNTWQGNFEALWKTIDTRYCYLEYKHIQWDSIHTVYQNRLNTVTNEHEFFNLMGSMLEELKDGHVNLYSDFDKSRYWNWFQDYPSNFRDDVLFSPRYLGSRYLISGGMRYGKIQAGSIGYIYYGDFTATFTQENLRYVFSYLADCKGLIMDVRNNGGGYLTSSETLASCFFDKKTLTGYMAHKTGDGHDSFSKPIALYTDKTDSLHWNKPVVVLTNRLSYSATNAFVNRMRYAPKATIVGDRTGGGGGLPLSNELPNGWLVRFSACPMFDADMQHIEWGIDPDVKVDMGIVDANNGIDSIIERAIALLNGL